MALLLTRELTQPPRKDAAADTPDRLPPQPPLPWHGEVGHGYLRHADAPPMLPRSLECDQAWDLLSDGYWNLHHVIQHFVRLVGPCHLYITSWGVTHDPLKAVLDLVQDHQVERLNLILDGRVKTQSQQAWQLLVAARHDPRIQVRCCSIHAKVVLIMNDRHRVLIRTSANLTRNPRIETYCITTHHPPAEFAHAWLTALMTRLDPFA